MSVLDIVIVYIITQVLLILAWQNVLRIKVIFCVTGQKIKCKNIEQVREEGRRKKKPFLFKKMTQENTRTVSAAVERD